MMNHRNIFLWLLLCLHFGDVSAQCTTETTALISTTKCYNICADVTSFSYSVGTDLNNPGCIVACPDGTTPEVPYTFCESAILYDNPTLICSTCSFAIDCVSTLISGSTACLANVKNPITVTDRSSKLKREIGTTSYLIFACADNATPSADTCSCSMKVDDTFCNACSIAYIELADNNSRAYSVLVPNFDCTNVLSSDCAVYIDGNCMSTNPAPSPVAVADSAEVYKSCQDAVATNGVTYNQCLFDASSPLSLTLSNGITISLGTESYAIVTCETGTARSIDTCYCNILVDPSDPWTNSELCNSCTILEISDTEFRSSFDCSNRLIGDCAGLDSNSICISNVGEDVPVPVQSPISTPAPRSLPTPFPRNPVTPAPIVTETLVVTTAPLSPPTPFPVFAITSAPRSAPTPFPVTTLTPRSSPTIVPVFLPPTGAPRSVPPTAADEASTQINAASKGDTSSAKTTKYINSSLDGGMYGMMGAFFSSIGFIVWMTVWIG